MPRVDSSPALAAAPAAREARAGAALALAALLWSGNFIAGRALRDEVEPTLLNLLRWSLCLALLVPWIGPKAWRCRHVVRREWKLLVALGVSGVAAFHTLVYAALRTTGALDALLMLALTPVAILAGSALSGATRPSRLQWSGAGLSLLGTAILLTRGEPARLAGLLASTPGELCMLLAVVLWAAYSLLLRRRPPDLPPDVALMASIVPALLPMLAIVVATWHPASLVLSARVAGALAYIVIFASLLAFLLWSYGVDAIGAERAGPYLNLMPVFGAALAVVLLGESLEASQMTGAAAVFGGIGLVARRRRASVAPG